MVSILLAHAGFLASIVLFSVFLFLARDDALLAVALGLKSS